MAPAYLIRLARKEEVPLLPEVERTCAAMFAGLGLIDHRLWHTIPEEDLHRHQAVGRVWVVEAPDRLLAGFAVSFDLEDRAHLEEIDVLPAHQGRGLGRGLVDAVCAAAATRGLGAVTLSTFREVPWNAPFFARLGFRILSPEQLTPGLVALREAEARIGLPADRRVLMIRDV